MTAKTRDAAGRFVASGERGAKPPVQLPNVIPASNALLRTILAARSSEPIDTTPTDVTGPRDLNDLLRQAVTGEAHEGEPNE